MAFNKYANGAWEEPETTSRHADGAWQECEFANRYVSGAWETVWEAIRYMSQQNNTLPSGSIVGYVTGANGRGWGIWYFESGNTGGGSVTYYLDGEFTNPSISFDYDGFFMSTASGGIINYATVGKLDICTRDTSGQTLYSNIVSSINIQEGVKNFSGTFNGTYNRVGIRFTFQNWNVSADLSPQYMFNIYNILIDGMECLPSKECQSV